MSTWVIGFSRPSAKHNTKARLVNDLANNSYVLQVKCKLDFKHIDVIHTGIQTVSLHCMATMTLFRTNRLFEDLHAREPVTSEVL